MPSMIIANRLSDGLVVFLDAGEKWVPAIAAGLVIDERAAEERWLAVAKTHEDLCLVVDPTLIEVEVGPHGPKPTALREAIRAFGPTI
jgi:Protein of unknown function (DUF2849)